MYHGPPVSSVAGSNPAAIKVFQDLFSMFLTGFMRFFIDLSFELSFIMGCVLRTRASRESRRKDKQQRPSRTREDGGSASASGTTGPADGRQNHNKQKHQPPPPQELCNLRNFTTRSATNEQGSDNHGRWKL
ncbi:unnamed protein product [Cuscuta epithymum]|uniref:Uncharacterized protein n=1 Tax=Cuscuta epithymum TaxID=186058 RepID=A0AAV0FKC3_9ASTE|nr:unnamed protein product [Cuscuta epithymum]